MGRVFVYVGRLRVFIRAQVGRRADAHCYEIIRRLCEGVDLFCLFGGKVLSFARQLSKRFSLREYIYAAQGGEENLCTMGQVWEEGRKIGRGRKRALLRLHHRSSIAQKPLIRRCIRRRGQQPALSLSVNNDSFSIPDTRPITFPFSLTLASTS